VLDNHLLSLKLLNLSGRPVSAWVRLLPLPCRRKAFAEIRAVGCPVQLIADLGRVAVDLGVVSWSPRKVFDLDGSSGRRLARCNKLLH